MKFFLVVPPRAPLATVSRLCVGIARRMVFTFASIAACAAARAGSGVRSRRPRFSTADAAAPPLPSAAPAWGEPPCAAAAPPSTLVYRFDHCARACGPCSFGCGVARVSGGGEETERAADRRVRCQDGGASARRPLCRAQARAAASGEGASCLPEAVQLPSTFAPPLPLPGAARSAPASHRRQLLRLGRGRRRSRDSGGGGRS